MSNTTGFASKMQSSLNEDQTVEYGLVLSDQSVPMNQYLGKPIALSFTGNIECLNCQRKIKKTYSQGYCFPCSQKLAACDLCIMKPENCHHHLGTCREPEWGDTHCMIEHYVYLSVTSDLKVGLTRTGQVPTRWIDQGASKAAVIMKTKTRRIAGFVEVVFKDIMSDKTNWRALLKGENPDLDLHEIYESIQPKIQKGLKEVRMTFGDDAIVEVDGLDIQTIQYPIISYPEKIKSLSFDKMPQIQGVLQGIKGQYLILDQGVLNMRKHTSYELEFSAA